MVAFRTPLPHLGMPLEQVRAGHSQDVDRVALRPGQEVLDELEQPAIGPVEVLEYEDHRVAVGYALEEGPPRREQLLARTAGHLLESEQTREPGLDPPPFLGIGQPFGGGGGKLRARGLRVVGLRDAGALANHLGQRPEADALAVGRGPAGMPVRGQGHAVDVLLELPTEAALADARLTDDGHEPRLALADGGVEQVLEQAQLLVTTHERRFQRRAPSAPPRIPSTWTARHAGTGVALPFSACSPTSS